MKPQSVPLRSSSKSVDAEQCLNPKKHKRNKMSEYQLRNPPQDLISNAKLVATQITEMREVLSQTNCFEPTQGDLYRNIALAGDAVLRKHVLDLIFFHDKALKRSTPKKDRILANKNLALCCKLLAQHTNLLKLPQGLYKKAPADMMEAILGTLDNARNDSQWRRLHDSLRLLEEDLLYFIYCVGCEAARQDPKCPAYNRPPDPPQRHLFSLGVPSQTANSVLRAVPNKTSSTTTPSSPSSNALNPTSLQSSTTTSQSPFKPTSPQSRPSCVNSLQSTDQPLPSTVAPQPSVSAPSPQSLNNGESGIAVSWLSVGVTVASLGVLASFLLRR